jgi:hypothetical protein
MVSSPAERRGRPAGGWRSATARVASNRPLAAALIVAIPAFILYWRTLMPDVGFWDTAEFQAIGPVLGIAHPTGYPAYTMLAWLASVVLQPFGDEALRANLMSALLVSASVGTVAATVTLLTGRVVVGVATGVVLAVSGEAWAIALHADPHALHLMLTALLLFSLVIWAERVRAGAPADRWLIGSAALFAVALGNHALTLLLAPGIGLFVLLVDPGVLRRPRLVLACVASLVLLTVAIYAYLPLRSAMNPPLDYGNPETWDGFRYVVFAEQFRGTFRALPDLAGALRTISSETIDQLGIFSLLALVGAVVAAFRRPALVVLLLAWFALNWYFALGYINADIGRYYLVPLLSVAVLGGLGAGALWDGLVILWRRVRPQPIQPSRDRFAYATVALVAALLLIGPSLIPVPGRFSNVDESGDRNGRAWLDAVMAKLPPDSVVVSWWSYSTTLWYGQYVEHLRPDITVIDDSTISQQGLGKAQAVVGSYFGRRPVYVIRASYDLPQFEQQYVLTPLPGVPGGPVYRVDGVRAELSPRVHL